MDEELTPEQKATNAETYKHIHRVRELLNHCISNLLLRSHKHDQSKLKSPEVEIFTEYTPKLKNTTYDSDEYKKYLKEMEIALDHHYKNNSHHPEHYKNGIKGMSLLDLLEMVIDWKAAGERHADGNIYKSLSKNIDRFNISPQLAQILKNTIHELFDDE